MTQIDQRLALQVQIALARAANCQARARHQELYVKSGAYKERLGKVYKGSLPEFGGVPLTQEELLQTEVATIQNHIRLAEDHLEYALRLVNTGA